MKILHLNQSDIVGGAARAAYRIHRNLVNAGIDSEMIVNVKTTDDPTVQSKTTKWGKGFALAAPLINSLPLKKYKNYSGEPWSPSFLPSRITKKVADINPDIINLHWINGGFLSLNELRKLKKPIVWTMHDMWPFTGGCHYAGSCDNYQRICGACPQLGSSKKNDLSKRIWQKKNNIYSSLNLWPLAPSKWLADCARSSKLFENLEVTLIPYGIDTDVYKPIDKRTARRLINIPEEKTVILFGALKAVSDPRKGYQHLKKALGYLKETAKDIVLAIFGSGQPKYPDNFGFETHYIGTLKDDISLAVTYAAADVFVAPSEQDNLPNTVIESLACGTPCVAFNIGGMPDMIDHDVNGQLVKPFDAKGLSESIIRVLNNKNGEFGKNARQKVLNEFSKDVQAQRYIKFYDKIIKENDPL